MNEAWKKMSMGIDSIEAYTKGKVERKKRRYFHWIVNKNT